MRVGIFAAAALLAACAAPDPPTPAPRVRQGITRCVPNQTLVCVCGLDEGSQRCTEAAELTPCLCPGAPPAPEAGSTCGDGLVDPGEACDDGNTRAGDGCSPQCVPDGAPASGEACPGQPLALWRGAALVLWGTTTGHTDDVALGCAAVAAADRVYAVRTRAAGELRVQATFAPGADARVALRVGDCEAAAELVCADPAAAAAGVAVRVDADRTYHLVVEGAGPYAVRLELP